MTEPKAYRAAGWISFDERSSVRLTSYEQAGLPEAELLRIATELSAHRGPGTVTVGTWSRTSLYLDGPDFQEPPLLVSDSDQDAEGWLQHAMNHRVDRRDPVDPAHWAAQAILSNLSDRSGFDHIIDDLDYELRQELVDQIAATIRRSTNRTQLA